MKFGGGWCSGCRDMAHDMVEVRGQRKAPLCEICRRKKLCSVQERVKYILWALRGILRLHYFIVHMSKYCTQPGN